LEIKKSIVLHPILFGIFFIGLIYVNNINILPPRGIILPLFLVILFIFLLWFLLRFILKDGKKSGLVVSLFVVLFFSYGHFYNIVNSEFEGFKVDHEYFLIPFIILLIVGSIYFIKTKRSLDNATIISNVITGTLIVIVLINIVSYNLENSLADINGVATENIPLSIGELESLPDIYYLVFDEYANSNPLMEIYDYNNNEFIDFFGPNGEPINPEEVRSQDERKVDA